MWQLLREWPPGYGGVGRVAHELATAWSAGGQPATVFSLVAQPQALTEPDPLPVAYRRRPLLSWTLGRLVLPLPSHALLRLLMAPEPLHAHLPCPTVLVLALVARLLGPQRMISLHWHSFLEPAPTPAGRLFGVYQWLAERLLPCISRIVTTSPVLRAELIAAGVEHGLGRGRQQRRRSELALAQGAHERRGESLLAKRLQQHEGADLGEDGRGRRRRHPTCRARGSRAAGQGWSPARCPGRAPSR